MDTEKRPGAILVIDDEDAVRELLKKLLSAAGHSVETVESGELALSLLAKQHFDLLVVDKNLPGIGGLEILQLVRSKYPGLMAVMVTGRATPESQTAAMALGVHSYVTKPFGIIQIVRTCEDAIRAGRTAVGES